MQIWFLRTCSCSNLLSYFSWVALFYIQHRICFGNGSVGACKCKHRASRASPSTCWVVFSGLPFLTLRYVHPKRIAWSIRRLWQYARVGGADSPKNESARSKYVRKYISEEMQDEHWNWMLEVERLLDWEFRRLRGFRIGRLKGWEASRLEAGRLRGFKIGSLEGWEASYGPRLIFFQPWGAYGWFAFSRGLSGADFLWALGCLGLTFFRRWRCEAYFLSTLGWPGLISVQPLDVYGKVSFNLRLSRAYLLSTLDCLGLILFQHLVVYGSFSFNVGAFTDEFLSALVVSQASFLSTSGFLGRSVFQPWGAQRWISFNLGLSRAGVLSTMGRRRLTVFQLGVVWAAFLSILGCLGHIFFQH